MPTSSSLTLIFVSLHMLGLEFSPLQEVCQYLWKWAWAGKWVLCVYSARIEIIILGQPITNGDKWARGIR